MSPDIAKYPLGVKAYPSETATVRFLKLSEDSPREVSWVKFPTQVVHDTCREAWEMLNREAIALKM